MHIYINMAVTLLHMYVCTCCMPYVRAVFCGDYSLNELNLPAAQVANALERPARLRQLNPVDRASRTPSPWQVVL